MKRFPSVFSKEYDTDTDSFVEGDDADE